MSELGGYDGGEKRTVNLGPAGDHQEEKERAIAKAALSIAELSACCEFGVSIWGV